MEHSSFRTTFSNSTMKRLPNSRNRFDRVIFRIVYLRGDSGFNSGSGFTLHDRSFR